jgi:HlyD family secretion protein
MRSRGSSGIPQNFVLYLLAVLLLSILGWAAWAELDIHVVARGRLVNPSPHIAIRPLEAGVLTVMNVRPGQIVRRGEVLALLDPTFAGADLQQLAVRDQTLRAQLERLRREAGAAPSREAPALNKLKEERDLLDHRQAAYVARLRQYDAKIASARAAIDTNFHDQRVLAQRLQSLQELEAMQLQLSQDNFQSRSKYLEARERRLEIERDLTVARNRQPELEREVANQQAEREAYVTDHRKQVGEEMVVARRDGDETREQLNKAQRRAELVKLIAPQDAVVLDVKQAAIGSIVHADVPLLELVPLGETLIAEVEVAPSDIAEVRTGDPVRVKLDTYPFQKHGTIEGVLESIGGDAVPPPQAQAGLSDPANPPVPSYVARIKLGQVRLERTRRPPQLIPGMTLSAEIVVGRRSVLAYVMYPILKTMDEAWHEP